MSSYNLRDKNNSVKIIFKTLRRSAKAKGLTTQSDKK